MTQLNTQWWYERHGAQQGPVAFAVLQDLAAAGELKRSTLVWTAGMPGWVHAETIPELDWPGSQIIAEGSTPQAPAPALGAPPPFFGRTTATPQAGGAPAGTWGARGAAPARSPAEAVQGVGEINVTTTILLSLVTLTIYGVVKFFQTVKAYERLAGFEGRFTTWFWVWVGTSLGAIVLGAGSEALRVSLGIAAIVFQFLTLYEALRARNVAAQRAGVASSLTSDTTHYVLLALGMVLAPIFVGLVLLVIQAVKWFQDWNATRAAALRRPAAAQMA
jgi:hypothetical protein